MESQTYKYAPKYPIAVVARYFSVIVISSVGIALLPVTFWSFARKLSVYTDFMEIKQDSTFFIIAAGLICFPTVILTVLLKPNKLNYLLPLLALKIIAISSLFAGFFIGTVYKLHFANETLHLTSTIPKEDLNFTLFNLYINNDTAIDKIHQNFNCCGIEGKDDFVDYVPQSCCRDQQNCNNLTVYSKGCLRSIQEDVAWHNNIASSLSQLFILMYIFNASMAATVFISDYFKMKSAEKQRLTR